MADLKIKLKDSSGSTDNITLSADMYPTLRGVADWKNGWWVLRNMSVDGFIERYAEDETEADKEPELKEEVKKDIEDARYGEGTSIDDIDIESDEIKEDKESELKEEDEIKPTTGQSVEGTNGDIKDLEDEFDKIAQHIVDGLPLCLREKNIIWSADKDFMYERICEFIYDMLHDENFVISLDDVELKKSDYYHNKALVDAVREIIKSYSKTGEGISRTKIATVLQSRTQKFMKRLDDLLDMLKENGEVDCASRRWYMPDYEDEDDE